MQRKYLRAAEQPCYYIFFEPRSEEKRSFVNVPTPSTLGTYHYNQ